MKRTILFPLPLALAIMASACAGPPPDDLSGNKQLHEDPTQDPGQAPGLYSGGEKNTFSHQSDLGGNGARVVRAVHQRSLRAEG